MKNKGIKSGAGTVVRELTFYFSFIKVSYRLSGFGRRLMAVQHEVYGIEVRPLGIFFRA